MVSVHACIKTHPQSPPGLSPTGVASCAGAEVRGKELTPGNASDGHCQRTSENTFTTAKNTPKRLPSSNKSVC